jgi:hypothetical protein
VHEKEELGMAAESSRFKVVSKDGNFEIREYREHILGEVEVEADYDAAIYQGFSILADYIFGNNASRTQIEMTAPVTEQKTGERMDMASPVALRESLDGKKFRIAFTLPSKYSLASLPEPNNKQVKLRKVDPHRVAALRFSGYLNRKLAEKEAEKLDHLIKMNKLTAKSGYIFAEYNPPWIPGPFRHDEVMAEV